MLAGAARLWRSGNIKAANPSWISIKNSVGSNISAIAIAEGDGNIVWVGHNDGRIYRTANALATSPTWLQVDNAPPGLPNRWCSKIVIDPADSQHVYVSFMGYQPNNVWRTNDNGASWAQISGTPPAALPSIPVSSIAMHRTQSGWLYVGTDIGVFASENDGQTWTVPDGSGPLSDGPANVEIDELLWKNDNTLIAATHGRGIYSATIVPPCAPSGGDADCNGHVDLADFVGFAACLAGPNASPGPSCGAFDFGADADVDLGDFAAVQNGFTG
jgi:ligand-binding sensor domain-containing protein